MKVSAWLGEALGDLVPAGEDRVQASLSDSCLLYLSDSCKGRFACCLAMEGGVGTGRKP